MAGGREQREIPLRKPTRSRTNDGKRRRLAAVGMTVGSRYLGNRLGFDKTLSIRGTLGPGGETRRGLDEAVGVRGEAGLNFW